MSAVEVVVPEGQTQERQEGSAVEESTVADTSTPSLDVSAHISPSKRSWCPFRFFSPTIEMDVGAADYNTAYPRYLAIEYLLGLCVLVSANVYGFVLLRRYCVAHESTLLNVVIPPLPILAHFGAHGFDIEVDGPLSAYCKSLWIFAVLSAGLGVGSYFCRRLISVLTDGGNEQPQQQQQQQQAPSLAAVDRGASVLCVEDDDGSCDSPLVMKSDAITSLSPLSSCSSSQINSTHHRTPPRLNAHRVTAARHAAALLPAMYTVVGLIFIIIVHGPHFFLPLLLILANYLVFSRLQRWCSYRVFMTIMWVTHLGLLYVIELYAGFELNYYMQYYFPTSIESTRAALGSRFGRKGLWETRMRWYVAFRMTTLRLIAFNYDLWEATHSAARARQRATDKHDTACVECAQLREQNSASANAAAGAAPLPAEASRCYKYRTEHARDLADYSLVNYLAYVVFPPLYLAGPMSSFNAFVSYMRVPSTAMPLRKMAVYALRILGIYATLVVLLHYVFVTALSSYTFLTLEMTNAEQGHFFFYSLAYIWLKFSFIWKSSRLFAMLSGIEVPEDIRRCFCNTLTIREYWRDWHASFNLWIVRYMYIPMGGRARVALSILPIFLFIALWHDPALHLVKWALCIAAMFVVELVVSACFGWVAGVFRREMADAGADVAAGAVEDGRTSPGSVRGVAAALLRPAARFTVRHLSPRVRAWCYRMLRVLGGMCTVFGLIVANLIGFSMQNSAATVEKSDYQSVATDADKAIARSLRTPSLCFVVSLILALYGLASLAAIDRDLVYHQTKMLKARYGLQKKSSS